MKNIKIFLAFSLGIVLLGCASGSTIITGEARVAIDPSEIKIYLDPPFQYETIGLVEASSDVEFSRQVAQDRVIAELKKRAAEIGANGVLLIHSGNTTNVTTRVDSNGSFYSSSSDTITGQGRAIFVTEEWGNVYASDKHNFHKT